MTPIKVGITGTHASGKTFLIRKMKKHYTDIGRDVVVVDEVARDCKFPIRTIKAQKFIWHEQYAREVDAHNSGCNIILCDRTLADNLVYLKYILNEKHSGCGEDMFNFFAAVTRVWMKSYTHIVRLPLNLEYLKADDPIRPKSVEYAMRIDKLFDKHVSPYVNCVVDDLWAL